MKSFQAPLQIETLLSEFEYPWFISGGWAIDLFLERQTRPHKDVDIAIRWEDQLAIQAYLGQRGWILEKAMSGQLIPWLAGELIEPPVHIIWCKNATYRPDFLEILFEEITDTHCIYRRDRSITLVQSRMSLRSELGLPFIAPELALLYKAKYPETENNSVDFHTALPALETSRRAWLKTALEKCHPDHVWLKYF